jgi:hypothetical protein
MEKTLNFYSQSMKPTATRVERDGRKFMVVPGVPLVEGVLNKRYVPAEQFGYFVNDWNDIPVVLRHPNENRGSARVASPDVPVVGRFYKAQMDGSRLIGEFWLDEEKLNAFEEGKQIIARVEKGLPVEVSTGYFSATTPAAGNFKGVDYSFIDSDIHPDHIALLPDQIGACSIQDGCGLMRNSANIRANCSVCPCASELNMTGDLPEEAKRVWGKVYEENKASDGEEVAVKKAWGAVENAGWRKSEDGSWAKANVSDEELLVALFGVEV